MVRAAYFGAPCRPWMEARGYDGGTTGCATALEFAGTTSRKAATGALKTRGDTPGGSRETFGSYPEHGCHEVWIPARSRRSGTSFDHSARQILRPPHPPFCWCPDSRCRRPDNGDRRLGSARRCPDAVCRCPGSSCRHPGNDRRCHLSDVHRPHRASARHLLGTLRTLWAAAPPRLHFPAAVLKPRA